MIRVALRGLAGRKLRSVLTALAIVLGVAMVSGTYVLTDTIDKAFDRIFVESYAGTDAVVSGKGTDISFQGQTAESPPVPERLLARVRALPEVEAATGVVADETAIKLLTNEGKAINTHGAPSLGFGIDPAQSRFNPLDLVEGRWASARSEVVVDEGTADDQGYRVGDSVPIASLQPARPFRIVGLARFGGVSSIGSATFAVFDLRTAQELLDQGGTYDNISVAATRGVSPEELVRALREALPASVEVTSGTEAASDDSAEISEFTKFIRYFLLAFAGIALFVGAFVIFNTLSITVAQRTRELATLRTIGASRRQVLWSVVLEGAIVGAIASVIGLFLGLALAKLLNALLASIGIELPTGGLVFSTRTIVVSLLVGTGIAVLASLRPALRATRIPPISAVREGAVLPRSRYARLGAPVALTLIAVAVALLAFGVFVDLAIVMRLLAIAGGTLLLFIGVALFAPRFVRPLTAVLGWPGERLGGVAGSLARENATRNPGRTASTAAALMIGLALVTFVSILGQGLRSSFSDSVEELFVADYSLNAGDDPLNLQAARAAERAGDVEVVSSIRGDDGELFGEDVHVNGVEPSVNEVLEMSWHRGSDRVLTELGADGAFVKEDYAEEKELALGSRLRFRTPTGEIVPLTVKGIFEEPTGGSPFGDVGVSAATFDRSFARRDSEFTFVNMRGGVSERNTAQLREAVKAFPEAQVETRDEFRDRQLSQLDTVLNVLYALLALSIVVSLFGIVNTLVLSVFERTRELGMLRAIGMTRRQVRWMIRHESIVTALIGAALGIAVGAFLAALITQALSDAGIVFAIPYGTLAVFVAVAIAAGMLAAILPARRASRLNVLEALQYE